MTPPPRPKLIGQSDSLSLEKSSAEPGWISGGDSYYPCHGWPFSVLCSEGGWARGRNKAEEQREAMSEVGK
jgi:hypothetical protein